MIYGAPPVAPAKKKKTLMIVAVVVILLVVIAAIAAAVVMSSASNNGNNGGSIFGKVSMTASSARPYVTNDALWQPANGMRYVMVSLNISNGLISEIPLNPIYFKLTGSDGISYTYSWLIDYNMASAVAAGGKEPVTIYFLVPVGVTASSIDYSDLFSTHTCSASLTSVWSSTAITEPAKVLLTGLSYQVTASGNPYITPDAGNRFINVTVKVTNLETTTLTLSSYYFEVNTADGLVHSSTYLPNTPAVPSGLQAGASLVLNVAFEISQTSEPTILTFNNADTIATASF
jgi:hypothetical protein